MVLTSCLPKWLSEVSPVVALGWLFWLLLCSCYFLFFSSLCVRFEGFSRRRLAHSSIPVRVKHGT